MEEIVALAQQRSGGRVHIYMYNPTCEPMKANRLIQLHEFDKYRLEHRAHERFGVWPFVPADRLRQPLSLGARRRNNLADIWHNHQGQSEK